MEYPKIVGVETLRTILKKRHSSRAILSAVNAVAQYQHCTKDHRYNGWTNYETWNVALWMGEDGNHWAEIAQEVYDAAEADKTFTRDERAALDLCDRIKEDHENYLEEMGIKLPGTFGDLLSAALSEVDWYTIAEHYIDDVDKEENATADAPETE